MSLKHHCAALLFGLLAAVGGANAEQKIESGEYVVHYSAVPATSISPEIARQYGITRSSGRGLLNVAVQRKQPDGLNQPVPATVTAAATNLAGQRQALDMREVREGDAIYYLGEPRVADNSTLDFDVEVSVPDRAEPIRLRFSQEFFASR